MNEQMKIFIVEVSKMKCFTATFKAKPGGHIVATNLLKIKNQEI